MISINRRTDDHHFVCQSSPGPVPTKQLYAGYSFSFPAVLACSSVFHSTPLNLIVSNYQYLTITPLNREAKMTLSVATEHPSDIFRQAVQSITATVMADLISCGKTHVYKQAAHPDRNGEARISFIEKAERMLTAIMIKNPMLAQTIADRFCRICGGKFVRNTPVAADKSTLAEELLDNLPALSYYTEIMKDPAATIELKQAAKRALLDEIEQDFDKSLA